MTFGSASACNYLKFECSSILSPPIDARMMPANADSIWSLLTEWIVSLISRIGLSSIFDTLFANSYLQESAKLLVLGSIIETGRRLCQWLIERFQFREFCSFPSNEILLTISRSYGRVFLVSSVWRRRSCLRMARLIFGKAENKVTQIRWRVNWQTEENVWKKSRDFIVTSRSSRRKWAVTSGILSSFFLYHTYKSDTVLNRSRCCRWSKCRLRPQFWGAPALQMAW